MPAGRAQIVGVTAVPGLGGQLLPAQLPHVVSEGESQVECSGPQPTGCLFRSAVSALVTRHAHVGGDPLQDNVGATSNELVEHDDYFFNYVFSRRLTVDFNIGAWYRLLKKFNAMKMATNSAVKIETCGNWYFFVRLLSCGTTNASPILSVVMDPSVYTHRKLL